MGVQPIGPSVGKLALRWGPQKRTLHAEDPSALGFGLCGIKLGITSSSPAADRCIVCRDLSRRGFIDRG